MKKIEAIVEPVQFQDVKEALSGIGVRDLTISEIRAVDPLGAHTEMYRGVEYTVDCVPKIKIEAVVADELADDAVAAIAEAASPRHDGAGKIFISPVEEVFELRSGSRGHYPAPRLRSRARRGWA